MNLTLKYTTIVVFVAFVYRTSGRCIGSKCLDCGSEQMLYINDIICANCSSDRYCIICTDDTSCQEAKTEYLLI